MSAAAEPSPRHGLFSAAVGDQLYMWGGLTPKFFEDLTTLSSTIHRFCPLLDSWEHHQCSGPPPPAVYEGACASIGDHMYFYGGFDGHDYQNYFYQLDTKSLKWQQLSNAGPMKKSGCRMISYGKKLLLFGGDGIPSGPAQPGSQLVKITSHSDGREWTNELHTFDLEEGEDDRY